MNKNLIKIREKAAEIMGNTPAERARIIEAIAEAQAAKEAAQIIKDTTIKEAEFAAAEKTIAEAESRENFNRRLLEHIDKTPRMSEEEYSIAINTCNDLLLEERDKTRAIIDRAMSEMKEAIDAYREFTGDMDGTLRALDSAANLLQVKYGQRWERKALRLIDNGKAWAILCEGVDLDEPSARRYSVYCAAWHAIDKAYPEHRF